MNRVTDGDLELLLVDDDTVDRLAVSRALGKTGLVRRVVEATDAEEALALMADGGFDCVLLDYHLPKADGLSMLRLARARGVRTPIVFLTGQGDEEIAVSLMKEGAADYLAKANLSPDRLGQSITRAVRLHRAEQAALRSRSRLERLHGLTAALGGAHTVAEVARVIVEDGRAAFEVERIALAALCEEGDAVEILHTAGFPDSARQVGTRVTLDESAPLAAAIASSQPAFDDGLFVLPLVVGSRVIGILSVRDDRYRAALDEERVDLESFASVAAQSLDRARLFDLAQTERARAEEASRTKDEFLAVVSHELRTPLNAMLGWATLVGSGALVGEEARRAGETIERNARAQAQIIEDLLDVSRIVTGKLRLTVEPFDLRSVLDDALDVVRAAADAKGVTLVREGDLPAETLRGDAERLRQVFWNLLSNAVKFTPRRGRVRVTTRQDGDAFAIAIEDDGQGIDPSFLPHVFERFRQQDTGTTRKTGGLGLGLAIVRHIVEAHGGSVEVVSVGTGRGSTFTVRLPATRASSPRLPVAAPVGEGEGDGPQSSQRGPSSSGLLLLAGARVLVVDDERDARELLATVLGTYGASVTCADGAAAALAAVVREPFDVVLSDIGMPGEDGYDFVARLRVLPGAPPAVALTAFARPQDRARALEAGYVDHATKPFRAPELARTLARAVAAGRRLR